LSLNNEVIILKPITEIGVNLQKKKFENMVRVFDYRYSDFLEQNQNVINFFETINLPNVSKVYPHLAFCKENSKNTSFSFRHLEFTNLCLTHDKDNFFFFYGYHPSLAGAKMINDLIINKIYLIENK
jgi:hypothetical protein